MAGDRSRRHFCFIRWAGALAITAALLGPGSARVAHADASAGASGSVSLATDSGTSWYFFTHGALKATYSFSASLTLDGQPDSKSVGPNYKYVGFPPRGIDWDSVVLRRNGIRGSEGEAVGTGKSVVNTGVWDTYSALYNVDAKVKPAEGGTAVASCSCTDPVRFQVPPAKPGSRTLLLVHVKLKGSLALPAGFFQKASRAHTGLSGTMGWLAVNRGGMTGGTAYVMHLNPGWSVYLNLNLDKQGPSIIRPRPATEAEVQNALFRFYNPRLRGRNTGQQGIDLTFAKDLGAGGGPVDVELSIAAGTGTGRWTEDERSWLRGAGKL